ncbi:MAG: beta-N-acetylhexosaminidase [Pseudonocardiales bacterium]
MDDELERHVDACLLLSFTGTTVPDELVPWLQRGLGAVILFAHNIPDRRQAADLVTELRKHAPDLLVGIDEEGGDVTRLDAADGSAYPGNAALGHVDDVTLTTEVGTAIGAELAALGINLTFAPVADVNTDPRNPVIGVRSFGGDPALVARHTRAAVLGIQRARVAACAKHFPGHGATSLDSHTDLPHVTGDLATIEARDLPPFVAAVDAGVRAIMTAHVVYDELDDKPATVSRRILTGLLREKLGFDGVIITDALKMAAIRDTIGVAEGAVRSLAAGADLVCIDVEVTGQQEVRAAVLAAARDGRLDRTQLAASAARVHALQTWARPVTNDADDTDVTDIGLDAARRALILDCAGLPLRRAPYVIDAGACPMAGIAGTSTGLLAALRHRDPATRGSVVQPPVDVAAMLEQAGDQPVVLAVRDAHRLDGQRALLDEVLAARPDAVVVGCGTAADAALAPGRYVGTLGRARVNLQAAAEVLLP